MREYWKAAAVRAAVAFVAGMVARASLLAAIGLALAAIYLRLAQETEPAIAALATAGAALIFAAIAAGVIALALRSRRKPGPRRAAEAAPTSPDARLAVAASWIAANPKTAALVAFGAGLVLGYFPDVRKDVVKMIGDAVRPKRRL